MGRRRAVVRSLAIGVFVGASAGCTLTPPPDPLLTALQHTAEPGDIVGPTDSEQARRLAEGAGLSVGDAPTLFVSPPSFAPPPVDVGWTRLRATEDGVLWRRRDPVEAPAVSVVLDDLPGRLTDVADASPVRGLVQHGAASPGGELALTLFLQPPARMPRRPCVVLGLDDQRLPLGTLLDGRGGFVPGAGPRPVVRHRALASLPADWPIGTYDVQILLQTCDSGRALSPPTPVSLTVAREGRPSLADLIARVGISDTAAEWARPRGRRAGLRRNPDGGIDVVAAPPLQRILRGDAWDLLVTPPVDPGSWPVADGTVGPLSALAGLFDEADASVVHWGAVASREGASPEDRPVRRVVPEVMAHLTEVDVDGVLLGQDAWAVDGGNGTRATAEALGLSVTGLDLGDNDNAVSVSLLSLTDGPDLASEVDSYRQLLGDDVLLLGVIEEPVGSPESAARRLAEVDLDAGWVVAEELGPVIIRDGVPVVAGVPPMGSASRDAVALRWYVAPEGVVRLDLVGMEQGGGRWRVSSDGAWTERFHAMAARSDAAGTWVAVGENVAAVDVSAHGPDPERPPATAHGWTRPPRADLPTPSLPARCQAEGVPAGQPIPVGDRLELLRVDLSDTRTSGPDDPVIVDLTWRASGRLPPGDLQWYAAGVKGTWRATTVPCDGMWGFERFEPGTVVHDRVLLFPPDGLEPGQGTLQLGVKLGDERPEFSGERFLDVGTIEVE